MGNFHTAIGTSTLFRPEDLNPIFSGLDQAISFLKNLIVHCDGSISYDITTGTLSWSGTIRIELTNPTGLIVENTIAAGSLVLASGEAVYVDLNTTTGTALTPAKTTLTGGTSSPLITANRLVLGYRNTVSAEFYPLALRPAWNKVGDMAKAIYDTDDDGKVDMAEDADFVPWSGVENKPANITTLADLVVSLENAGKVILINEEGTAFILGEAASGGGAATFIELTDAPAAYTGAGGKVVAVKADASGLEFISLSSSSTLAGLGDVVLTSIADGQSLKWDAATSKFINYTPSSGGTASFASVATISMMMGGM